MPPSARCPKNVPLDRCLCAVDPSSPPGTTNASSSPLSHSFPSLFSQMHVGFWLIRDKLKELKAPQRRPSEREREGDDRRGSGGGEKDRGDRDREADRRGGSGRGGRDNDYYDRRDRERDRDGGYGDRRRDRSRSRSRERERGGYREREYERDRGGGRDRRY